jgi:predicted short-subunit dehydrogenase-like oxidoreductase (DUF2520 family)
MHYGLIGAGPVNEYFAGRLPRLRQQLGPVAATSHKLASRIVNTMKSGVAKRDISGLADCPLILICAPGKHIRLLLDALRNASVDWRDKSLVICESEAFSRDLDAPLAGGAFVASLRSVPGANGRYLVEGDRPAVRAARQLIHEVKGSAIEIAPHNSTLYCAAMTLASSLFTPILESCSIALRGAGMVGPTPATVTEAAFAHTLRMYLYSGRKSWTGPVAQGNWDGVEREIASLESVSYPAAQVYRCATESAEHLLRQRHPVRRSGKLG